MEYVVFVTPSAAVTTTVIVVGPKETGIAALGVPLVADVPLISRVAPGSVAVAVTVKELDAGETNGTMTRGAE
jgi:hypothetical protein